MEEVKEEEWEGFKAYGHKAYAFMGYRRYKCTFFMRRRWRKREGCVLKHMELMNNISFDGLHMLQMYVFKSRRWREREGSVLKHIDRVHTIYFYGLQIFQRYVSKGEKAKKREVVYESILRG